MYDRATHALQWPLSTGSHCHVTALLSYFSTQATLLTFVKYSSPLFLNVCKVVLQVTDYTQRRVGCQRYYTNYWHSKIGQEKNDWDSSSWRYTNISNLNIRIYKWMTSKYIYVFYYEQLYIIWNIKSLTLNWIFRCKFYFEMYVC